MIDHCYKNIKSLSKLKRFKQCTIGRLVDLKSDENINCYEVMRILKREILKRLF